MPDQASAELLGRMKRAVGRPAELKMALINLRSHLPSIAIFVFEGDDDRAVYYSWVRYVDSTFRYEPFTCRGKGGVLALKGAVDRDAGDLGENVYFFIDRDFDDSRGVDLGEVMYMTEMYSIENHLVVSDVLDEALKIEFHCHGQPAVRTEVRRIFEATYEKFIRASVDINREIYAARKLGVELRDDLPKSVSRFAGVTLNDVVRLAPSSSEVVQPERPITQDEFEALEPSFSELDGRARYRGKFAFSFFLKWLELLARERTVQATEIFRGLDSDVRVRVDRLSLTTLAARSVPPQSLVEFLQSKVFRS